MRPFALIAVVAAHIALLTLLSTANRTVKRPSIDVSRSVLVFVSTSKPAEPSARVEPRAATKAPPFPQPPIQPSPPTEQPSSPPPVTDWAREAELSVARQIAADEAAHDAATMFSGSAAEPTLRPVPEFGWSRTAIQPIEALPEGGFLVWLNERCAIYIGIMAMPFCRFGEIPARGDLFEHMADAPQAGDWKD